MSNKPRDCYYMVFQTDSDANPSLPFFFKSEEEATKFAVKRSFEDRARWSVCKYECVALVTPNQPRVEYTAPRPGEGRNVD